MSLSSAPSFTGDPDAPLQSATLALARVEALVFRAAIDEPVATSFGVMHDRPAVFIRIEDVHGGTGWGEVWCNFPAVGAEHRARMFDSCVAPILLERTWSGPQEAFHELVRRLHILALQSGEPSAHRIAARRKSLAACRQLLPESQIKSLILKDKNIWHAPC